MQKLIPDITGDQFRERLIDFFRRTHPTKTALCISAETKGLIKEGTAAKWLEGRSLPSGLYIGPLIEAYGPRFLLAIYGEDAPDWVLEGAELQRKQEILTQIEALMSEFDSLNKQRETRHGGEHV